LGRVGHKEAQKGASGRRHFCASCAFLWLTLSGEWWVVSVTLRRWSERTTALQAVRDLYAANNPKCLGACRLRQADPCLSLKNGGPPRLRTVLCSSGCHAECAPRFGIALPRLAFPLARRVTS